MNKATINQIRVYYVDLGFITNKGIQKFCKCGYKKAKEIINEITHYIKSKGKKVSPLGINTIYLLEYMGIDEETLRKRALEDERKQRNDSISR